MRCSKILNLAGAVLRLEAAAFPLALQQEFRRVGVERPDPAAQIVRNQDGFLASLAENPVIPLSRLNAVHH